MAVGSGNAGDVVDGDVGVDCVCAVDGGVIGNIGVGRGNGGGGGDDVSDEMCGAVQNKKSLFLSIKGFLVCVFFSFSRNAEWWRPPESYLVEGVEVMERRPRVTWLML